MKTKYSGWLYAWAWGIQQASTKQDDAWKFISWASGKEYEHLVGAAARLVPGAGGQARLDVRRTPPTSRRPAAFPEPTQEAIENADPNDPGVQPRPAPGIQFVGIPEFPDLGTQVSQEISSAIAGPDDASTRALNKGQQLADDVAERYRSRAEVTDERQIRAAA